MSSKSFSYLVSVFRGSPVNPSTPCFPISTLQKQCQNYVLFGKSLKVCCLENHRKSDAMIREIITAPFSVTFHHFTFNMSYKSYSYLTSLSGRVPLNSLIPIFGNIKLMETTIDLIVDWKSNQNGRKYLFLHPKLFKKFFDFFFLFQIYTQEK